jgi:hypothetical protein
LLTARHPACCRFKDARKMWGTIINRSRDIARQGSQWLAAEPQLSKALCRWTGAGGSPAVSDIGRWCGSTCDVAALHATRCSNAGSTHVGGSASDTVGSYAEGRSARLSGTLPCLCTGSIYNTHQLPWLLLVLIPWCCNLQWHFPSPLWHR